MSPNTCFGLTGRVGIAVLAMAIVFGLTACPNPVDEDNVVGKKSWGSGIIGSEGSTPPSLSLKSTSEEPEPTMRYKIVPYKDPSSMNSTPYFLADSCRQEADGPLDYYLYCMGYVENVPIVFKDNFRYEGIGTQTISFEKKTEYRDEVTESMTKSTQETWGWNASVTASVEWGVGGGAKGIAESTVKVGVEATAGYDSHYGKSASNTYETSQKKISAETQSLSVTLDRNDAKGKYRYALFGTVDVYCLFTVDSRTRKTVGNPKIYQCARENEYFWVLDFEPLNSTLKYGKTDVGDSFSVPVIDFSKMQRPDRKPSAVDFPQTQEPVKTKWSQTNSSTVRVEKYDVFYERFTINPAFDVTRLRAEGYQTFHIKIDFIAKEVYDGYVDIYVLPGHRNDYGDTVRNPNNQWAGFSKQKYLDLEKGKWNAKAVEFDIPLGSINDKFTIVWDATGKLAWNDYDLSTRTVTIEAKKPGGNNVGG
jgi:hypothetical protein